MFSTEFLISEINTCQYCLNGIVLNASKYRHLRTSTFWKDISYKATIYWCFSQLLKAQFSDVFKLQLMQRGCGIPFLNNRQENKKALTSFRCRMFTQNTRFQNIANFCLFATINPVRPNIIFVSNLKHFFFKKEGFQSVKSTPKILKCKSGNVWILNSSTLILWD